MPSFTRESGGTLHVAVMGVNRIGKEEGTPQVVTKALEAKKEEAPLKVLNELLKFASTKRMWTPPAVQEGIRTTRDMRSGTVVCPASQVRHACAAGPYGVRGSDPNRSSGMLDSPACRVGFSDPVSLTFCPYVVFRPTLLSSHRPGSSTHHGLKQASAEPGIPIPNSPLLFQAAIPQQRQSPPVPGNIPS